MATVDDRLARGLGLRVDGDAVTDPAEECERLTRESDTMARLPERRMTLDDAMSMMVGSFAEAASSAPNCMEWRGTMPDGRGLTVSVQWAHGKSPHDLLAEARELARARVTAERDTYRSAIDRALSRLGAEDYDDPCAALAECLDYADTLDREATDEANALRVQRDEARRELTRTLNSLESITSQLSDATRERDDERARREAITAAVREYLDAKEYAGAHDVDDADIGRCTLDEFSGGVDRLAAALAALRALVTP